MNANQAKRLLKTRDCRVKIDGNIYTTRHTDFIDDVIYIREQKMYQDYQLIESIEYNGTFVTVWW